MRSSNRTSIGGALNAVAYRALAELHRPQSAEGLAAAVRELARQGLRARDIAQALRLTVAAVTQLLDHPLCTED